MHYEYTTRELNAAAKGADLLDEQMPGWADRINLSILELEDKTMCVLGQLFDEPRTMPRWEKAHYSSIEDWCDHYRYTSDPEARIQGLEQVCVANYDLGVITLREAKVTRPMVNYGFDAEYQHYSDDDEASENLTTYAGLDEAWTHLITDRQVQPNSDRA